MDIDDDEQLFKLWAWTISSHLIWNSKVNETSVTVELPSWNFQSIEKRQMIFFHVEENEKKTFDIRRMQKQTGNCLKIQELRVEKIKEETWRERDKGES